MNSKPNESRHLHKLTYLVVCMFTVSYLLSMNNVTTFIFSDGFKGMFIYDDTIPPVEEGMPDTNGLVQETVVDGIDTVWYLGYDTITTEFEEFKLGILDSIITINLGSTKKTVTKSLFGFATAGIFQRLQMPNDSSSLDQWQWISDIQPQVLRFPGGADSKFMDVLSGPGYGYDLQTIVRYFDMTDSILDYPTLADVLDDASIEDSIDNWVTPAGNYVDDYKKFKESWNEQQNLDSTHKFIDDFIEMVKKIEVENGITVKVVYCLNIFSNSATQCADIVKYLRDSSINHIYPVNVIGVEMGNEPYFDYAQLMMGWESFEDYWDYLNGINSVDTIFEYVLGDSVWNNHDFIGAFKNNQFFHCPIGIPAENLKDSEYALFSPNGIDDGTRSIDEDWNSKLREKYSAKENITGVPFAKRYAFDAVILHPYYDGHNWEHIPLNNLDSTYECNLDDTISTNDEWLFDTYDERLEVTFDTIGINFRKFLKTRYKESYDVHRDTLLFYPGVPHQKDLWVTEWNFKDQGNYRDGQLNRIGVVSHGFMHGYIVFEWFLKDIKLNYDSDYQTGFHTLSTFHNFGGGATNAMIHPASNEELDTLGKNYPPYDITPKATDPEARNYLMKRTTFLSFDLLSEITKNGLKYLQTNYTMATRSVNVQPSVFINPEQNFLYIYYSNIRDTIQEYLINTAGTFGVYVDGGKIRVSDTAELFCIDALKPYSTSGKGNGTLYRLNETYALAEDTTCNELYPIEIKNIIMYINVPWGDSLLTLTAPAYSYGYFKVPIRAYYPLRVDEVKSQYDMKLYPNPANNTVSVIGLQDNFAIQGKLEVKMINVTGSTCMETDIISGQQLDISSLSYGVYQIIIKFEDGNIAVGKLIKQ